MKLRAPLLTGLALALGAASAQPDKPALVEHTERQLIQLDVSLHPKKKGDTGPLPELGVGDFELVVAGQRVVLEYADRICDPVASSAEAPAPPPAATPLADAVPVAAPRMRGTYLFYFEHKQLTQLGQNNALEMAEALIPALVTGGNRGMVVSSGRKLIESELTDDPRKLLELVQSIRNDTGQWTAYAYAEGEVTRLVDVQHAISANAARMRARTYAQEEQMTTHRGLCRLAATLGALADLDPPKAVLYFADTMRSNPGAHYMELFGDRSGGSSISAFDWVTEEAGTQGVHLYTIQAQGLTSLSSLEPTTNRGPTHRMEDAERAMASLALETGGATFRGGTDRTSLGRVLDRVRADLGCFYLLSFPAGQLARDEKLSVLARFNPDGPNYSMLERRFEPFARGQIVIQSESKRRQSLLLAAHVAQDAVDADPGRGVVIPLSFSQGRYHTLVQLAVANPDLPASMTEGVAWDMGLTHVFHEKVAHQVSARIAVAEPGVPVILEAEWTFEPGTSEITAVAYEQRFGQLATVTLTPEWPDPNVGAASISPLAVVQPERGVFLRKSADGSGDGERRFAGTLGLAQGLARVDRPMYMLGLACRGRRTHGDLWIERKLVGNVTLDFPLQRWEWDGDERCVQIRDLISARKVGWGRFSYEVRIYTNAELAGEPLANRTLALTAVDPEQPVEGAALAGRP